nr:uncharacterized protein LOC109179160 [Ipomoea batatas]
MVEHPKPVVELEEVVLDLNYPDRMVRICVGLTESIKKEVDMLLAADHVQEVKYPGWLANVVLVPKPPAWRTCIDYINLNKACPKDLFPLPHITRLVDKTAGCALLSFMDAFRGYHEGYCYKVMPFGSKNSGATYMHMVVRLFKSLIGKSMAAFVDDMLVKSKEEEEHVKGLADCFRIMR